MAGDLSHEHQTGAARRIDSRLQFWLQAFGSRIAYAKGAEWVKCPMLYRFLFALRSVAAVVGGYLIVAAGTILTFNVLVGQVTVDSNPGQMILGTIGAMLAGIAGGVVAGVVAPRFPLGHAAAVLLFLALDTASVLAKRTGPAWFDLAGSGILAISVLFGGWIIARRARSFVVRPAV